MPVHNTDPIFFNRAVFSIIQQSIKDFELIIVDDGSKPKVDVSIFDDDRIICLRFTKNKGISYALNRAIKISSGEYIARMDSDDVSHVDRFQKQLGLIVDHDIISSNVYLIDENNVRIGKSRSLPFHNIIRRFQLYLLKLNPVNHPTIFAKAKVFKDFEYDEKYNSAQDFELWLRMAKKYKIYFDKNYVLDYRVVSTKNKSHSKHLLSEIR